MNQIILGTGSYDTVKSGNRVSISGDGGLLKDFNGPNYKKLAPRLDTFKTYAEKYKILRDNILEYEHYLLLKEQMENQYIKSFYETRLRDLDVYELLNSLEDQFGNDIILLCYENEKQFCHRRIVADYIELETGLYVPEVAVDEKGKVKELVPIRYTNRLKEIIK